MVKDADCGMSCAVGSWGGRCLSAEIVSRGGGPRGERLLPERANVAYIRDDGRLFRFYEESLGFTLGAGESPGLHYGLVNCPQGPERNPLAIPAECN